MSTVSTNYMVSLRPLLKKKVLKLKFSFWVRMSSQSVHNARKKIKFFKII